MRASRAIPEAGICDRQEGGAAPGLRGCGVHGKGDEGVKRRWICALLILLCVPFAARADGQDEYWTTRAELYYHGYANCNGAEGRVPISAEAAAAFDKYPCPVCVPAGSDSTQVQGVARGGTIVLRFPDGMLAEPELTGVFGWGFPVDYEGAEAWTRLGELLHGEEYAGFAERVRAGGSAETVARVPCVVTIGDELTLNQRHIGGDWYSIVRPKERFEDSWEMYWRIDGLELEMAGDALREEFSLQTVEEYQTVRLASADGAQSVFQRTAGNLEIRVYRELDANVAVICERSADADFLEKVGLRIGGYDCGVALTGYMDGSDGVFCCTLTDGELHLLEAGADFALTRAPLTQGADFMNSPYAAVQRGTGDMGIIDRAGNFVVEAKYANIVRPDPESFRTSTDRPFFCCGKDDSLTVLDGDTLEKRFRLENIADKGFLDSYINPSVFATHTETGVQLRSMEDGSVLIDYRYDADRVYDGYFRVRADGAPQCLVAVQTVEALQPDDRLADNRGADIGSGAYRRITPMVWSGDKGLFLIEDYDPAELAQAGSFSGELQTAYVYGEAYTGSAYGEGWRCGLIDQEGRVVAPLRYTCVEADADGTLRLSGPDGAVEIFRISEAGD